MEQSFKQEEWPDPRYIMLPEKATMLARDSQGVSPMVARVVSARKN